MQKRIVIVGAGPIGCYTAQLLKAYGFQPLLIEEHNEVGRPIHCTGLVGNKVFTKEMPFVISRSSIINTINGAIIHYDNQHFTIERERVAYVIDRERFDKELSDGLNILFQHVFLGVEKFDSGYIIETDKNELFADIVIGADGANSSLRKLVNHENNIRYFGGIQLRLQVKPRYKDLVEVYLKKPSFFWIVPEAEDIVRIGTISENPYQDLQKFLREEKIKGKIIEKFGGRVALGICKNTVTDNIALVGDAACQMKPLSFGGIYFGLKAASLLASCIRDNRLGDYDLLWKEDLAFEIKIGLKVKEIYSRLNPKELKTVFSLLKKQKAVIENKGDFENHGRLILEMIKEPAFYSVLGDILKILFRGT
ncbi:MAG: NAD(P)/FAD-dependent oxidoreductase [Candidatus Omnitrophica bacterium]|nr:NAD(P)/FAD-dependent oxidoreductase [Candidatus Omnitrophota bacterium]MDD5238475.1 NAD(P)/FAD-dependent oxidoreductase [Candidatus Omnitrophota bacterium]